MNDLWLGGVIPPQVKLAQVLLLISLALYLGTTGRQDLRPKSWMLGVAALAGLILSGFAVAGPQMLPILIGIAMIIAAAGALSWPPMPAGYGILAIGGFAAGSAAMPVSGEMPAMLVVLAANILGTGMFLSALTALALAINDDDRPFWTGVASRIACAWIAAIAVMLLAFELSV